ncbi:MAG: type I restriction enzyme HsdR N-terminal domain-containing protein [Pirellulaceae bacterium]|nr:type I restriction enzyme HsdR N-terminal domain-containing protein [Planctomycetales bacterium]
MSDLLGIAVCDECNARIRVLEKHKSLIGNVVRCPKCHTRFTLELEQPTNTERIAVEDAEPKTRKRRSKNEIREEHIATAKAGVRALHERLGAIAQDPSSSEEQVRIWCLDLLRTALGYDDSDLVTECSVMGGRVDIAVKVNNEIVLIIECKNIRSRLRNNVRDQAGVYAVTLSAPWAVVTNGDIWKLYRVTPRPGESPSMRLVFDLAFLDEDGINDADAEHLYLISRRALRSGDTEHEYHTVACTCATRVYEAIFSERVVAAIRRELTESYRDDNDQRIALTDEDARDAVHDLLTPLEFGK